MISEYYKEGQTATVYQNPATKEYGILYFNEKGSIFHTEQYPGKALNYVEDAAENWALGIKEI